MRAGGIRELVDSKAALCFEGDLYVFLFVCDEWLYLRIEGGLLSSVTGLLCSGNIWRVVGFRPKYYFCRCGWIRTCGDL